MKIEDCFELGIISKLHSFKGEVILFLDSDEPDHYYEIDSVFLEINKQLVPFFISKSSVHKVNQLRIRFEGVDNEDQAKLILKKKVFLPLTELPSLKDDQFYYHEIPGYTLFDHENNKIGKITDVIENPANVLISVLYKGNEALVPLNDSTFKSIDKKAQTIKVFIPEGLLDLYC
jgi:16S rRNA processing protein RimM